jgi:hypothetical protein
MSMQEHANSPRAAFKDRKAGLVVFGVLEILIGVVCALFAVVVTLALVAASFSAPGEPPLDRMSIIAPLLVYGGGAVFFVWAGVGSIMARRWARAVMLMASSFWLVTGTLGYGLVLIMMPGIFAGMQAGKPELSPEILAITKFFMVVFRFLIGLAQPTLITYFYRSPHVKATCEHRDPVPRWTDRRPLPVLLLALLLGLGAPATMLSLLSANVVPLFGVILTGAAAVIFKLVMAALLAYLAKQIYDLKKAGWTALLVLSILGYLSSFVTFFLMDASEFFGRYYEAMGYSSAQIEEMLKLSVLGNASLLWMTAIWTVVWTGYLVYVRKFFRG